MQALDTFSHHRMVLQSLPDGWCDRLEQDLQNLDFESAYKTCLACEIAMEEHRPDPSDMT